MSMVSNYQFQATIGGNRIILFGLLLGPFLHVGLFSERKMTIFLHAIRALYKKIDVIECVAQDAQEVT